jgi:hypothetical protein
LSTASLIASSAAANEVHATFDISFGLCKVDSVSLKLLGLVTKLLGELVWLTPLDEAMWA